LVLKISCTDGAASSIYFSMARNFSENRLLLFRSFSENRLLLFLTAPSFSLFKAGPFRYEHHGIKLDMTKVARVSEINLTR